MTKGTGRFWLVRLDDAGELLWDQIYGDIAEEQLANDVVEFPGDGFALAGTAHDDFWLVRTDVDGEELWDRSFDFDPATHDRAVGLARMADDGLALAGWISGVGFSDYWVVRADAGGDEVWNKAYDKTDSDFAEGVVALADGGLLVVGSHHANGGSNELWAVRTDPDGGILWDRTHGGVADDAGFDVVSLANGDLVFAGLTASKGAGAEDAWALRTDPDGLPTCR